MTVRLTKSVPTSRRQRDLDALAFVVETIIVLMNNGSAAVVLLPGYVISEVTSPYPHTWRLFYCSGGDGHCVVRYLCVFKLGTFLQAFRDYLSPPPRVPKPASRFATVHRRCAESLCVGVRE